MSNHSVSSHSECIVVGLGVMGSAAAYHLAKRGRRVLALEQFAPLHALGSSHGRTRIIREAYFEHPAYVPLVQRAYALWHALEAEAGRTLFVRTGGLMAGPPDGMLVSGALASARAAHLPHEELTAAEIRRRFPAFAPADDEVGVFESRAGVLYPELCLQSLQEQAARAGAELRFHEHVDRWDATGDGVRVHTARGSYHADRLVLAAGPWMTRLLAALGLPLDVERQVFHWFAPAARAELFGASAAPVVIWEYERDHAIYTVPDVGHGVKAGIHHDGAVVIDPDRVDRVVHPEDEARTRRILARIMPDLAGRVLDSRVCLYTNTPDRHFLIDSHPEFPQVLLASPCSGHGFKFASAIGEVIADWSTGGRSPFALELFARDRLLRA